MRRGFAVLAIVGVLFLSSVAGVPLHLVYSVSGVETGQGTTIFHQGDWIIDGIGTRFSITSDDCMDVTLRSTEEVHVLMESIHGSVSIFIERECSADTTDIELRSLPADTPYYRYQDGQWQANMATSESGFLEWTQDITEEHHISIQTTTSTITIMANGAVNPSTAPISVAVSYTHLTLPTILLV